MQKNFTIDKQEYMSVFRVIDKDDVGKITVEQVNSCITKIYQMHRRLNEKMEQAKLNIQPMPK